jgi:hypothetical protein
MRGIGIPDTSKFRIQHLMLLFSPPCTAQAHSVLSGRESPNSKVRHLHRVTAHQATHGQGSLKSSGALQKCETEHDDPEQQHIPPKISSKELHLDPFKLLQ